VAYDGQTDSTVLAAIAEVRQEQKLMLSGFNVMLDHIVSIEAILESILEAVSADPDETENPLADALRQLVAVIADNTRAIEAMPAQITSVVINGIADVVEDR